MDAFNQAAINAFPDHKAIAYHLHCLSGLLPKMISTGLSKHSYDALDYLRDLVRLNFRVIFADVATLTPNELGDVVQCILPDRLLLPIEKGTGISVELTRRRIHARYLLDKDSVFKRIVQYTSFPDYEKLDRYLTVNHEG